MTEVVIVNGVRTAGGNYGGVLREARIDEVIVGNVLRGQGQNTARQSVTHAGIPKK